MQTGHVAQKLSAWCAMVALVLATLTGSAPLQAQGAASKLNIVIVDGDGAVNNIRQRVAREPIVRVEDENRKPIAGATVVFLLPSDGAGGLFPGGERMLTMQTDQAGQAAARGLQPNNLQGDFVIRVTASYQGRTATALINQTNAIAGAAAAGAAGGAAAAAGISGKVIGILAVVGAAVAAGTYAATRNGNGGTSTPGAPPRPTTSVSIGTPSVGAP